MMNLPTTHRHLKVPALHAPLEPFRADIESIVLPAWRLNARTVKRVSGLETHFLGDSPYVPIDIGWPNCDHCGQPLTFMWQINFREFSRSRMIEEQGLFQFFYCWKCFPLPMRDDLLQDAKTKWEEMPGLLATSIQQHEGICYRWYPDFDNELAKGILQVKCPNAEAIYSPPMCCRPKAILSLPDMLADNNPIPEESAKLMKADSDAYKFTQDQESDEISQLGGYPEWIQDDDTPACPVCGRPSVLVGALGSGDTDVTWGDSGYWYIFACKATPECKGLDLPLGFSQSM